MVTDSSIRTWIQSFINHVLTLLLATVCSLSLDSSSSALFRSSSSSELGSARGRKKNNHERVSVHFVQFSNLRQRVVITETSSSAELCVTHEFNCRRVLTDDDHSVFKRQYNDHTLEQTVWICAVGQRPSRTGLWVIWAREKERGKSWPSVLLNVMKWIKDKSGSY